MREMLLPVETPRDQSVEDAHDVEIAKMIRSGFEKNTLSIEECGRRLKKSALFKALLFSTGAHVPLLYGDKLAAYARSAMSQLESWDGRILHPQSKEDQKRVEATMAERAKHADLKGIEALKEDARKKIEAGEPVLFRDIYFGLEEKNGVPKSEVDAARKKADELIAKYSGKFANGFDRAELDGFVRDMYGSDANYDWGQGSVTVYFNSGKRNCNAVAKGQLIVLEGVLEKLPADVRKRIQLGNQYVQQHVYATATNLRRDGKVDTTYLLEPGLKAIGGDVGEAGTATVSLDDLKKSIVSNSPLIVDAKKGAGISKGPILDTKSDQPVDDNIAFNGPLRPSDYVLEKIGEKKPEETKNPFIQQETAHEPDVMEVTLEETFGIREAMALRDEAVKHTRPYEPLIVRIKAPVKDPTVINELMKTRPGGEKTPDRFVFTELNATSENAFSSMLFYEKSQELKLVVDEDGNLPPQLFDVIREGTKRAYAPHVGRLIVGTRYVPTGEPGKVEPIAPSKDAIISVLKSPAVAEQLYIPDLQPTVEDAKLIAESSYHSVVIGPTVLGLMDRQVLETLAKGKPQIYLSSYTSIVDRHPEILAEKNFHYIEVSDIDDLREDPRNEFIALGTLYNEWNRDKRNTTWIPLLLKRVQQKEREAKKMEKQLEEFKKQES